MDKQNERGMVDLLNQEMRELQAHQKQIEEIVKLLEKFDGDYVHTDVDRLNLAMEIKNILISENVVVLERNEAIGSPSFIRGYELGKKETAEKFAEKLKEVKIEFNLVASKYSKEDIKTAVQATYNAFIVRVDEICKEFTEANNG